MNFLRELVSRNKTRYVDEQFNLDLTYITPRVIGMSYPAEGLESMFRNRIRDVSKLLNKNHSNSYLVVNVSNRKYKYSHFNNSVVNVKWPDHYPCTFSKFIGLISQLCSYLMEDENNTLAVHCLMGKGRTGSVVVALLYSSGVFESVKDANKFYLCKRACNVSKPSQLRYLDYYNKFFDKGMQSINLTPKKLSKITIKTKKVNFLFNVFFKLQFYDYEDNMKLICQIDFTCDNCSIYEKEKVFVYTNKSIDWSSLKSKDIVMTLKYKGLVSCKRLFRVNFNLLFHDSVIRFWPSALDSACMELPSDFSITLDFEHVQDGSITEQRRSEFQAHENKLKKIKSFQEKSTDINSFLFGC